MRECRLCLEAGYQITPGAIFTGNHKATIMIIGQAPGQTEVEAKRPFNAGSGRRLFQWLEQAGWTEDDFRRDHYMTAVTKCFPGKNSSGRGDRIPTGPEQELCRPFLQGEIRFVAPRLIIPVGGLAIGQFYDPRATLKEVVGSAKYAIGVQMDNLLKGAALDLDIYRSYDDRLSRKGLWIVPLPHPSGASAWPNKSENKALIEHAITILADIREEWNLK